MSTPAHGLQQSLSLQEVYAWVYAMQCRRLALRMHVLEQTDFLARAQAFEGMSALLDEALEEIRVVTEALRESARLQALVTEQRAQRSKAKERFSPCTSSA